MMKSTEVDSELLYALAFANDTLYKSGLGAGPALFATAEEAAAVKTKGMRVVTVTINQRTRKAGWKEPEAVKC